MSQRFYRFAYTNRISEGHPRLHHSRDGAAFNELTDVFYEHGYRYGTVIHNYPHHGLSADHFTFLKKGDLVVCTTRPPLDDLQEPGDKDWRRIERSDDHLEKAIFQDLRRFFQHISRYSTILTPEFGKKLPKDFGHMATINFHTRGKGTIESTEVTRAGRTHKQKTGKHGFNAVGFFLHLPKITGYPCGLIASFSMGGYENLYWNRIVRQRYASWFSNPVFAFALLELPEEPVQPLTPMQADNARAKILFELPLDA